MRRTATIPVLVLLAAGALAGCGSGAASEASGSASSGSPTLTTADTGPVAKGPATAFSTWSTYHQDPTRRGHVAKSAATPLHRAWSRKLNGAVYGDPLVVGSSLLVATEGDRVYSLNAHTGRIRWSVSLGKPQPQSGLPCGDIDPLGVTGTPAYDADSGLVFAVAETLGGHHTLWAVDARTGTKKWHRNLDVLPDRNRLAEQERSAVLVEHHRVVVTFGGLSGDCDNYVGYVTSTSTHGTGRTFHYAVPTSREAGMWSPAGPVLGENGHVYAASGNGAEVDGTWDKSDSVTELDPVTLKRLSVFAPKTWAEDNKEDLDLGSSSPITVAKVHRIVIAGKRGAVYLLKQQFAGIGSNLAELDGCSAFGGAAVVGRVAIMPCLFEHQIRALRVGSSSLAWAWTAEGLYGSPVVAGARVYLADRDSGDLVVLRLTDGHVIQKIHAGDLTHFPSEVVDGGYVFVPTLDGITAFHGPRR